MYKIRCKEHRFNRWLTKIKFRKYEAVTREPYKHTEICYLSQSSAS